MKEDDGKLLEESEWLQQKEERGYERLTRLLNDDRDEYFKNRRFSIKNDESVGKGSFGTVFKGRDFQDVPVVVKFVPTTQVDSRGKVKVDERLVQGALKEAKALTVVHEKGAVTNVVQLLDMWMTPDQTGAYFYMEFAGQNSFDWLKQHCTPESLKDKSKAKKELGGFIRGVLEGFAAVHKAKIVHLDIKCENLFMLGNVPKIIDLGTACGPALDGKKEWKWDDPHPGTVLFLAPEWRWELGYESFRHLELLDSYKAGLFLLRSLSWSFLPTDENEEKGLRFRSCRGTGLSLIHI